MKVIIGEEIREYEKGTSYEEIANDFKDKYDSTIGLVKVDGNLTELFRKLRRDGAILEFLTLKSNEGFEAYRRSCSFLFVKAAKDVLGDSVSKVKIELSLSKGFFCRFMGDVSIDNEIVKKIDARMKEIIAEDLPITKQSFRVREALEIFKGQGMEDKGKLFKYRRASTVNLYLLDGYYDYFYGYMLPSTGYLDKYELYLYDDGICLQLPTKDNPNEVPEFKPQNGMYKTMMESIKWGEYYGIDTVGALNDCICNGQWQDLVLVQEAYMESRISKIAADIVSRPGVKFIMIAGPSSSGKTTFSHRLSIQLRAHGMVPHPIALDDYYVNRDKTPLDEDGNPNFECLEALDVKGFNDDMVKLLAGERVELPTFNFKTGKREYNGKFLQLGEEDVLVIEGIHGLNEKMSYMLPAESKYKIYISALTALNVDEHNRIATTDSRLIRRMVRDYRTRGASAQKTLSMWPSVRRGEEENIFPFQETADAQFNSALVYELAVLKQFAEPILFSIQPDEPEYLEAKKLLKFLDYFLGMSTELLPNNSIAREFVGGSLFPV